jgi:hypothetical protein
MKLVLSSNKKSGESIVLYIRFRDLLRAVLGKEPETFELFICEQLVDLHLELLPMFPNQKEMRIVKW